MATNGEIKTLYGDEDKTNAIYPRTVISAITGENDKTLKENLDDKQDKTDSSLKTSSTTIVGAINEVNESLSNKQNKSDSTLETTSKAIVGAINEINNKPMIYYGTVEPSSSIGKDGDIYVKYSV